ncbi:hypothetical protein GQ457_03G035310 [Hibiscus cannabinus]
MENPVKSITYQKAKGMTAPFAFLFSLVVYASIFYVFSSSPSTLFNDNKFWFVISNTLILIIAADYAAFSSSKDQKHDLYEEYVLHIQATRRTSTAAAAGATKNIPMEQETATSKDKYEEEEDHATQTNYDIPEKILEVVEIEPRADNSQVNISTEAVKAFSDNGTCHHQVINKKKKTEPKTIRRSKSDKAKHVKALNDKTKGALHRSKTEKQHGERDGPTKDNEFFSMSNEELNRRVEEFIERFNREIRLQGVRNRQVLEHE